MSRVMFNTSLEAITALETELHTQGFRFKDAEHIEDMAVGLLYEKDGEVGFDVPIDIG